MLSFFSLPKCLLGLRDSTRLLFRLVCLQTSTEIPNSSFARLPCDQVPLLFIVALSFNDHQPRGEEGRRRRRWRKIQGRGRHGEPLHLTRGDRRGKLRRPGRRRDSPNRLSADPQRRYRRFGAYLRHAGYVRR